MVGGAAQAQLIVRLSLGLIFLLSASMKLRNIPAFVQGVLNYRVLPSPVAQLFGGVLPFVELGTGILLLSGRLLLVSASLALLLLISFAIALGINAARGRTISCHCFGSSASNHVGWHSLIRDLILFPLVSWLLWVASFGNPAPLVIVPSSLIPTLAFVGITMLLYVLIVEGLDFFVEVD